MINVTKTFLPALDEYTEQIKQLWDSQWLTNRGTLVQELELKLKELLKINNLLFVNNGTIALQIAIKSLELREEIITTRFSYVATVSSIVWENCTPIFVDIDPEYLTIDETKIESSITERTSAILATHVYGNPCNVEIIENIARKHNIKVIYDAAHCFGVKYKGQSIFNWGDISTLSFHATKLFHTAEGGAIICRNSEIAHRAFYLHNFGHNGPEDFWGLGVNGKVSEIHAALGLCLLPYVEQIISERKSICDFYDFLLKDLEVRRLHLREGTNWNYAYYSVIFSSETSLLKILKALNERQIFPRRYFYPSLNKLPYLRYQKTPIAEDISKRILCLPLFVGLENSDIKLICQIIKENI